MSSLWIMRKLEFKSPRRWSSGRCKLTKQSKFWKNFLSGPYDFAHKCIKVTCKEHFCQGGEDLFYNVEILSVKVTPPEILLRKLLCRIILESTGVNCGQETILNIMPLEMILIYVGDDTRIISQIVESHIYIFLKASFLAFTLNKNLPIPKFA